MTAGGGWLGPACVDRISGGIGEGSGLVEPDNATFLQAADQGKEHMGRGQSVG